MRCLEVALDLAVAAGEEVDDAVDRLAVLLLGLRRRRTARRSA